MGRVLMVENNDVDRAVALGVLAKLGYRADLAVDGREAVEARPPRRGPWTGVALAGCALAGDVWEVLDGS